MSGVVGVLSFARASPSVRTAVLASVVTRLPIGMTGAALPLLGLDRGLGPGVAGGMVATYGVAVAVTSPSWGRAADRVRPGGLLVGTSIAAAAATVSMVLVPASAPVLLGGAALLGAVTLPFGAVMRALWNRVLTSGQERASASAFESFLAEGVHIAGRVLVALLSVAVGVRATFVAQALIGVTGGLTLAAVPLVRHADRPPPLPGPHARGLDPLRRIPLHYARLLAFSASLGAFGMSLVVAVVEASGPGGAALALAAWGSGGLLGVTLLARRVPGTAPGVHARLLLTMAALQGLLLACFAWPAATVLVGFLAGLPIAASLTLAYRALTDSSPPARATEYLAWATTAIFVGNAAGAAGYGLLSEGVGPRLAALLAPVLAVLAAVVAPAPKEVHSRG